MCFGSARVSAALMEDISPECWPMIIFENDCIQAYIHGNPKDNPSPKLGSTDIFLKGRNMLHFPTPVLRNG